jgi:RHS repeat-associated protein
MSRARLAALLFTFISISLLIPASRAQVTNVTNDTSTPVEGAGHDYIHLLSETVNPATGSISLSIQLPVPKSRGFTVPFSLTYDSNSVHHLVASYYPQYGVDNWASNTGYLSQGGWSYSIPQLNIGEWTQTTGVNSGFNGSQPIYTYYNCYYASNYVFRDASASLHSLYLGTDFADSSGGDGPQYCTLGGGPALSGGDVQVTANLTGTVGVGPGPGPLPLTVSENDGTVYYFSSTVGGPNNTGTTYSLPSSIEDRNGNIATVASSGIWPAVSVVLTDTAGRPAISISGFGPSGTTNTITTSEGVYYVTWKTTSASFTVPTAWAGPSGSPNNNDQCTSIAAASDSQTVISQITLPNGQAYHFYYGTDNPNPSFNNRFGMLSEIDYPSGGWVRYNWNLSGSPNELADYPGVVYNAGTNCGSLYTGCPVAVPDGCLYQYETPVVTSRQVGFGGSSTPALVQSFSYFTTWAAPIFQNVLGISWTLKTTDVTSTDNVANQNFLTTYTYSPVGAPSQPFSNTNILGQLTVEQTTTYYNSTTPTNALRTVTKSWLDQFRIRNQQTTLDNGQTSQITYSWTGDNITEKDEYDFGQSSPTRKTINSYQPFSGTPGSLLDRPCQSIVYDGNGNSFAETDVFYDGGTTTCGTAGTPSVSAVSNLLPTTHDETTFAPSSTTSRGNATTVTKKCLQSCSNAVTTFTYDETGQLLSAKDACGNTTCSDMTASSHTTTFSYSDRYTTLTTSGQNSPYTPPYNTNAYLTAITNALGQMAKFTYDYNNGQLTASQNQNDINATRSGTTFLYNEPFNRPTRASYPDGGFTTIVYNDSTYNPSTPSPNVTSTKAITSTTNLITLSAMDGVGHVTETRLNSDPDGATYADTTYDGQGRLYCTSNPYRPSGTTPDATLTPGITTRIYDALGRLTALQPPDYWSATSTGSPTCQSVTPQTAGANPTNYIATSYSGNCATVTDQTGKARKSCSDGLGRLTQVFEDPGSSPHLNYETDYRYDVLDNLLCVAQNNAGAFSTCSSLPASWRPRTFTYDSLSRLTSATNPESGTISYSYDANGNLSTKTSPAPNQNGSATVIASYLYDALNRLTQKSFSGGTAPTVKYGYDATALTGCTVAPPALADANPVGGRTAMCDGAGAASWSHDTMARPLTVARTTNSVTMSFLYTYNFDGSPYQMTYPGQSSPLTYTQGGASRPLQLVSGGGTYITANAHYAPNGNLCYRQDDWDGSWTTTKTFNNRFQPITIQSVQMFSGTPPPVCGISPIYSGGCCSSKLDLKYSFTDATGHNNGNVVEIYNNLNMERTQLFSYDSLNRLSTAETLSNNQPWYQGDDNLSNCWGEQYSYDPWGNFSAITPVSSLYTGCTQESLSMSPTAKNQLQDTNNDYVYDAAGNLTQPGPIGGPYVYDAENHLTSADGVTYTYDGDGNRVMKSNGTIYWYGANSASLMESDLNGNVQRWYYFFDGQRVGRQLITNEVGFYMTDDLGSVRYLGGSATGYSIDYYPFGAIILNSDTGDDRYQFTGKERDSESGLDNFGARYDSSSFGRFMSPDPMLNSGRPPDPQTWNRYAYGRNSPINVIDPTGLYDFVPTHCAAPEDGGCTQDQIDEHNRQEQQFRGALEAIQSAIAGLSGGSPGESLARERLQGVLDFYGTEGDDNGVTVGFGEIQSDEADAIGFTRPTKNGGVNITFDTSKFDASDLLGFGGIAAHEGTHGMDIFRMAQGPRLTKFQFEYRADMSRSFFQEGYFLFATAGMGGILGHTFSSPVWNSSWWQLDQQTLRDHAVTSFTLQRGRPGTYSESQKHDPWQ